MRAVVWDTWAFLEVALEGPKARNVRDLVQDVDLVATSRDAVVETFNHLTKKLGRTEPAWDWWQTLRRGTTRILEPSLEEVHSARVTAGRSGRLTWTDHSLGWVAGQIGTREVATEDHEFRKLGLTPLFAKR